MALSLHKVYSDSDLLVLNRTLLNSNNALLVLLDAILFSFFFFSSETIFPWVELLNVSSKFYHKKEICVVDNAVNLWKKEVFRFVNILNFTGDCFIGVCF